MKRKRDNYEDEKAKEKVEPKEKKKPKRKHNAPPPGSHFPKRVRAHANPCHSNFHSPFHPDEVKWDELYPNKDPKNEVTVLDIGCAWGGLLCGLAVNFPSTYMLGMEIRKTAVDYSQKRIIDLRLKNEGSYNNIWITRNNVMKHLPNFFHKGQLETLFFCFPDPHFKKRNQRKRIISPHLLDEYAFLLKPKGHIFTITDVKELHEWMDGCQASHPLFKKIEDSKSPYIEYIKTASEDATRCVKKNLPVHITVYERIQ